MEKACGVGGTTAMSAGWQQMFVHAHTRTSERASEQRARAQETPMPELSLQAVIHKRQHWDGAWAWAGSKRLTQHISNGDEWSWLTEMPSSSAGMTRYC